MDKVVLAKVGDIELTKNDMVRIMRNLPQEQQQQVASIEGRKQLLNEMVAGELFYLQGAEAGYNQEAKYLELLNEAKRTILQQYTMQKVLENIAVSDEDMKDFYESNKDRYQSGASASAKHILMADEAEIVKVKEEITAGLEFGEAAAKYSTCPSKDRGGDLGSFEKGRMVPEFEDVAFTQELGVVSEPVKTQFGFHLIVVDKRADSSQQSFEEVQAQIGQELTYQKQSETYMTEVAKLKEKYPVEVFEDALA